MLAAGPQKPRERREPGDAVAAAVAPVQAMIESLSGELTAARAANEALRDQLAAAQSEAAELRGKSAANETARLQTTEDLVTRLKLGAERRAAR